MQHALGEWISILLKPLARAFCLVGGSERSPRSGGILGMVLLSGATRERERQQFAECMLQLEQARQSQQATDEAAPIALTPPPVH